MVISLKRKFELEARNSYRKDLKNINEKIETYDLGVKIGKLWVKDKITNSRIYTIDKSAPFYLTLSLSYNDELCREPQIFIEELEDMLNKELQLDTSTYPHSLLKYKINSFLYLLFIQGNNNQCRIIEEEIKEETTRTVYKTICT